MVKSYCVVAVSAVALLAACTAQESEAPDRAAGDTPPADTATGYTVNPGARTALFGDLHIHTKNSFDAYIFGVRATADDAYRFAKGETIRADAGMDIQLAGGPLDFLAVTDHGEYMGIVPAMNTPGTSVAETETARSIFGEDATNPVQSFLAVGATVVSGEAIPEIYDHEVIDSVWAENIAAAERHNDPGTFTTFAGYEFTAMRAFVAEGAPAGLNLHRNVIFRDRAPDRLFSTLNSPNPEDLWDWMDTQREEGRDVISIPHNSNASNGEMFALSTYDGLPLSADYAMQRMKSEPVVEMTQIKGTSETHPLLSPNDEWAGFEQYTYLIGSPAKSAQAEGSYVRQSIGRGLVLEDGEGYNPYKFGFIGSSDTHIAAGSFDETNHIGKFPSDGAPAGRGSLPPGGAETWPESEAVSEQDVLNDTEFSASGLAGVWAEENTREAIFDAMRRKETFGTSGPRIKVRMFASFDYSPAIVNDPELVTTAYKLGVPQGGELIGDDTPPAILGWALQDPTSAPLQRLQVIKVWNDGGTMQEAVIDIACSGGVEPDAETHRCPDNGASVDIADCSTEPGTGAGELKALWRDPDFDASQRAAYYIRVLENPTCRWSTWDAMRNGTPPHPGLPATLQERAWTSPIWVTPG